jgi:BolA protein
MDKNRPVYNQLKHVLTAAFSPLHLDIIDDSARHAGHSGARPEGETHFRVLLVSDAFVGESRVARQRRVFSQLQELMEKHIHALQLKTLTPDEYHETQQSRA